MHYVKSIRHIMHHIPLAIVFTFLLASTYRFLSINFFSSFADAAGYVSLLDAIRSGSGMVSPAYNTPTWMLGKVGADTPIYDWCQFPPVNRFVNFSQWHPFLNLFLIGKISSLLHVSSLSILAFLVSISYLVIPFGAYLYLSNKGFSKKVSVLVSVVCFCTPSVFNGLSGQIQADRLFTGFGFLLTLMVFDYSKKPSKSALLLISGVVVYSMTISERAAIYVILILLCGAIGPIERVIDTVRIRVKIDFTLLSLSLIPTVYYLVWDLKIQKSEYYSRGSFDYFYNNLTQSFTIIPYKTGLFLFSIIFFVCSSFFHARALILVIGAITPQFLWSTMGGEKVDFSGQYHAGYIGIVVAAGLWSLGNSRGNIKRNFRKSILLSSLYSFLIGILLLSPFWIKNSQNGYEANYPVMRFFDFRRVDDVLGLNEGLNGNLKAEKIKRVDFVREIPIKSWISTPEFLWPSLVYTEHRNLDYFPFGLREDDYFILKRSKEGENLQLLPPWLEYSYPDGDIGHSKISACARGIVIKSKIVKSEEFGDVYDLYKSNK